MELQHLPAPHPSITFSWDISQLSLPIGIFHSCHSLLEYFTVVALYWNVSQLSLSIGIFHRCRSLLEQFTVVALYWNSSQVSLSIGIFHSCHSLLKYFTVVTLYCSRFQQFTVVALYWVKIFNMVDNMLKNKTIFCQTCPIILGNYMPSNMT